MTGEEVRKALSGLLTEWCDALVGLQVNDPSDERHDGGLLCPACGIIHGRCHEAVYPLLCAAKLSGNGKYLTSAKRLFAWGENMLTPDGAVKNDFDSDWKGITTFGAIALHDALFFHGDLLSAFEKIEWEARLLKMGEWLYENLTEKSRAYLNYFSANACALELTGAYFKKAGFRKAAKRLAEYCLEHVGESGLIFGEGSPIDSVSEKGCRPVDVGYNVEETLPCLTRYAFESGDERMLEKCRELWKNQLEWMLPDGAWDDSVGTRSFKWTYWGSRTADGCAAALFQLGKDEAVFSEAAWRNFELLRSCTHEGLLTGGPDYAKNGERPCVHHTFTHAKILASALDGGLSGFERVALPSDSPASPKYFPELDTFRLSKGKWRMTVSGYDFVYRGTTHATGGCISLLWHKNAGALIAVGQVDFALKEPNNQQLSVHPETHRCACPRLEAKSGGKLFGQQYDLGAELTNEETESETVVRVKTTLCDEDGNPHPVGECTLEYRLTESALYISGSVNADLAENARYILPLVGERARLEIIRGTSGGEMLKMFNLSPGFIGKVYTIIPDSDGRFCLRISV